MSEDAILASIDRHFAASSQDIALGRGDDCAIIHANGKICMSSDIFQDNIHFRRSYFTPEEVGHKALAVNLSDLAAMGARPVAFQLALAIPDDLDLPWLEQFFVGMAELADKEAIFLTGGDISRSPIFQIDITVIGSQSQDAPLLRRGGVMTGDRLFVIGQLGLAYTGLVNLEKCGRDALNLWPTSCQAHLKPQPQLAAGMMLARVARNARPPSLMDISDGLASDLPRLLGINTGKCRGACLNIPDSILHPEVLSQAFREGLEPALLAYKGGEDYALLGACAPDLEPALRAAIPDFHCIGEVTDDCHILCNGKDLTSVNGFDHFRRN